MHPTYLPATTTLPPARPPQPLTPAPSVLYPLHQRSSAPHAPPAPTRPARRYLKLERNIPQTKWFDQATGRRIGSVSLAERIEAFVLPAYGAEATKFISG